MSETFTIHIEPTPAGLQVTVKELDIVLEVKSTRRDDALDAAHAVIMAHLLKQREAVKAS